MHGSAITWNMFWRKFGQRDRKLRLRIKAVFLSTRIIYLKKRRRERKIERGREERRILRGTEAPK
jgi:hypothetical protein